MIRIGHDTDIVTRRGGRIERMKSECSSTSMLELCAESAQWAKQRESELGHSAPNCPTAAELWRVVEILKEIHAGDKMSAQQADVYMQELEGISDKWLDPEGDSIGMRLHSVLEGAIEGLSAELEVAFPESAEMFRKKASLRAAKQAIQRTLYLRSLNPSWLSRTWTRLSARRSRSE
jgi:hypothetical protein